LCKVTIEKTIDLATKMIFGKNQHFMCASPQQVCKCYPFLGFTFSAVIKPLFFRKKHCFYFELFLKKNDKTAVFLKTLTKNERNF